MSRVRFTYTEAVSQGWYVDNGGLCLCGCGEATNIAPVSRRTRGWLIGYPQPYIKGHRSPMAIGKHKPHITMKGYVELYRPDHMQADKNGWAREHRMVMSDHLGRHLEPWENVHHINGDKTDNRLENLEVIEQAAHTKMHNHLRIKY